ncbi:MAG: DUF1800 family protein, partial [Phycisphaeraceae bacterium]
MTFRTLANAITLLLLAACLLPTSALAQARLASDVEKEQGPYLSERQRVVHALNRMAFGPRPGQVDRVLEMGLDNWMRQQLDPLAIDDPYVFEYIKDNCPSLLMTNGEIFNRYRPAYTPYRNDPPTQAERKLRREETQQRNRNRAEVRAQQRNAVYHAAVYSERQFQE